MMPMLKIFLQTPMKENNNTMARCDLNLKCCRSEP